MFYLSSKVEYGILGLLALARNPSAIHLSVRSIARRENLSLRFLEQAMRRLKEAGLIESVRGTHGGYRLTKDPQAIQLSEVVVAIEGESEKTTLKSEIVKAISSEIETGVKDHLSAIHFDDLARRATLLEQKEALMFNI